MPCKKTRLPLHGSPSLLASEKERHRFPIPPTQFIQEPSNCNSAALTFQRRIRTRNSVLRHAWVARFYHQKIQRNVIRLLPRGAKDTWLAYWTPWNENLFIETQMTYRFSHLPQKNASHSCPLIFSDSIPEVNVAFQNNRSWYKKLLAILHWNQKLYRSIWRK